MSTVLKLRRGTTAEHTTFVGEQGEMTVDVTKKTAVIHDGVTPGGNPLAREVSPNFSGTLTHSGDIVLSGSGKRITGDFSNATVANRVLFQTSTTNGDTYVGAVPNGTGTKVGWESGNYTYEHKINGGVAYSINTSRNFGFGVSPAANTRLYAVSTAGNTSAYFLGPQASLIVDYLGGGLNYINAISTVFRDTGGTINTFDVSQGVGVLVKEAVGLGYGAGAGGTVTQSTSKSTAVTLNKPTGQITMNNAALAAGASVEFALNNSLITAVDLLAVNPTSFGSYTAVCRNTATGAAVIRVTNISAGSLSEAVTLQFAVIKGAAS